MQNIIDTKIRLNDTFEERYHRVDQTYNRNHFMTWVRKDELKAAYATIISRLLSWPQQGRLSIALVPIFDMLNHNSKPNCHLKAAGSPPGVQVSAGRKISVGEELFLNYGLGF